MSRILSINGGSSSLKFALHEGQTRLLEGEIEEIGESKSPFWVKSSRKDFALEEHVSAENHRSAIGCLFAYLKEKKVPMPDGVGHRIVHGGGKFYKPQKVTPNLVKELETFCSFAPLHLPLQLMCIQAIEEVFKDLDQVVCFDTAFHHDLPKCAQVFPLPKQYFEKGIRRFGFHGLSYEYICTQTSGGKMIIAHLGNGCSLAAVKEGKAFDTSMGFSPSGGVMMGTRSGDLDPGLLLYLLNELGEEKLETLIDHESGLLGVSGISSDMKTLLEKSEGKFAVELFCYYLIKMIGAFAAAMNGLTHLVFTGGIGERAAPIRDWICQGLTFLGCELDSEKNQAAVRILSSPTSRVLVEMIPTNEDLMIALHTADVLSKKNG